MMKNKGFWIILAVAIAGLIGVFVLANRTSDNTPADSADTAITAEDHTEGPANAKATLVEYADLQCPACGSINPLVNRLRDDYPKQLRIVFRHFPLSSIHGNAFSAARAAEAAAEQDKFWEMKDLLYERQDEWSAEPNALAKFRDYAQELGLDIDRFNTAYNSQAVTDRINHDVSIARRLNVNATPTFYLNDQKLDNPQNYQEFSDLIKQAINN